MTTNAKTTNAILTPSCVDCGRGKYQVGRAGECCPDAPRFNASQSNVPTSPLFTADMLSALLADAEAAHKVWVDQLRAEGYATIRRTMDARENGPVSDRYPTDQKRLGEMIRELHASLDSENKAWAQWYGTFMAVRLNQAANAARWTPTKTLDVPPFSPFAPITTPADVDEAADEAADVDARRSVLLNTPATVGTDNDNASE